MTREQCLVLPFMVTLNPDQIRWVWHPEARVVEGQRVERFPRSLSLARFPTELINQLDGAGIPFFSPADPPSAWPRPVLRIFRQLSGEGFIGLVFGPPENPLLGWWDGDYTEEKRKNAALPEWIWVEDVQLRRDGGRLYIEAPGVAGRLQWFDPEHGETLLNLLRENNLKAGEVRGGLPALFAWAGFLRSPGEAAPPPVGAPHDRMFHWKWRLSGHGEARGAWYPGARAGRPVPPPHPAEAEGPGRVNLPWITDTDQMTFDQVLAARKSVREHRKTGLSLAQIGSFFARGFGQREPEDEEAGDERMATLRRSYPSAGGLHEIDCFLHLRRSEDVPVGLYYYDPAGHGLIPIPDSPARLTQIVRLGEGASEFAGRATAQIFLFARMDRLNWKYEGMAYALALQNTGACLHSLYLAAAATGLGICAIGNGDDRFLKDCPVLTGQSRWWVGHLLLGVHGDDP